MANEAIIVELLGNKGDPVRFTVDDAIGVAKGTLMYLESDPRVAKASSAQGQIFVGVAAAEKVASDGSTTLSVYTNGIFDLVDSGSGMTLGDVCKLDGANVITAADEAGAQAEKEVVGLVLETASASERVQVRVLK